MHKFKLHHYISLSRHFSKAERVILRSALDQISLYHDNESEELMKYSGQEAHGKLKIIPGSNNFFDDSNQTLTINFKDIGRVKYLENGQHRSVSLNGVLTHELVHAADNLPATSQFQTIVDLCLPAMLRQSNIPEDQIKIATAQFSDLSQHTSKKHVLKLLLTEGLGRVIALEKIKAEGYTALAMVLAASSTGQSVQMLKKIGQIDDSGNPVWKTKSVAFTDYLMKKNQGNAEPQRISYDNASFDGEVKLPYVLKVDPVANPTSTKPVYRANEISFNENSNAYYANVAATRAVLSYKGIRL